MEQTDNFESVYKSFEKEKNLLVEDLKAKHRQELERIEEKYANNKDALKLERQKLAEKYESEISRLRVELDESVARANKEKQEYEQNLSKLKSFHERELEACKQNSSNEYVKLIETLKTNLETLKKQKQADENEFNFRYNKKLEEIVTKEEEIKRLQEMLAQYKSNLESSSNDMGIYNERVGHFNFFKYLKRP